MRAAMLSLTLFSLAFATVTAWKPPSFTRSVSRPAVRSLEGKSLAYAGATEPTSSPPPSRVTFTARYRPLPPATRPPPATVAVATTLALVAPAVKRTIPLPPRRRYAVLQTCLEPPSHTPASVVEAACRIGVIEEAFRVLDSDVLELDDVEQAWYGHSALL